MRTRIAVAVTCLATLVGCAETSSAACNAIPIFADGIAPTNELHVSPSGSDQTGDGSMGNPFATIDRAADQAAPGTAVIVHAGTYAGGAYINDLAGAAAAPIWIGGAPSEDRPVIEGGSEGLHFVKASYLVLHDLEVRNVSQNGINCDDGGDYANPLASHHLVFDNLYIHDVGGTGNQDGLKLSGINDFVVKNCEMTRCGGAGSGSGIDMVGCHQGVIAGCYFHDLSANAVQCKGGSEDVEIRWCRMTEVGERGVNIGGSTGFEYFRPPLLTTEPNYEARDIRVLANVIEGGTASLAFVGCIDCVATNNTIVNPHNWILRILQETTSSGSYTFLECADNTVENNLVYFDRSDLSTYVNIGPNTEPATFAFTANLWYAHDNPSASEPTLPAPETAGLYGLNPDLRDPAAGDYRIEATSPAAGVGVGPARISGDRCGTCFVNPPSIGAYEVPLPGDFNCDGAVTLADYPHLAACLTGPAEAAASACLDANLTAPASIDLRDFALFQAIFAPE